MFETNNFVGLVESRSALVCKEGRWELKCLWGDPVLVIGRVEVYPFKLSNEVVIELKHV